jgi:toxin ParE1/3/4
MVEYQVKVTKHAENAMREIAQYISRELMNETAAINHLQLFQKEIKALSNMPESIKLIPEQPWHDEGIRRKRVKNFYICFWIDADAKKVQVTDVIYVGRDQSRQLENMPLED